MAGSTKPFASTRRSARAALVVALLASIAGCAAVDAPAPRATGSTNGPSHGLAVDVPPPERMPGVVDSDDVEVTDDPLGRWAAESRVEVVRITSTADGAPQDLLWAPPPASDRPLIVHVHSWGSGFHQEVGLPIALWADSVGWGFVQPDFRGRNDNPSATGSALTTQDVVDAVDFAVAEAEIDPDRVYVTGFSGGGMTSLLLAGRHADRFAGVAAWVPVYDLLTWYVYNRDLHPDRDYAEQIEASCSGDPTADPVAREDCISRSPVSVMGAIRDAGVPVYLGGGIHDDVVPVVDTLLAFNTLADQPDRIPDDLLDAVEIGALPDALVGDVSADVRFTPDDPEVLFSRSSAAVTVVVFEGAHKFVYYPGLDWIARLDAATHGRE